MAIAEIEACSGGSTDYYDSQYTLIQTGLFANGNRCTFDKGGYFVKSGTCFIDLTITITNFTSAGNSAVVGGLPIVSSTSYIATNNATKWTAEANSGNYYLISKDTTPTSGMQIKLIGAYSTSASDTV